MGQPFDRIMRVLRSDLTGISENVSSFLNIFVTHSLLSHVGTFRRC